MGAERLKLLAVAALALAACHREPAADPAAAHAPPRVHMQVVRALTTAERTAIVARFRKQNPGASWAVAVDGNEAGPLSIDPFRGFLRNAWTEHPVREGNGVSPEQAATAARAFVERNADLLGVPETIVHALGEDRGSHGDGWTVELTASYPSRGYETFHEIENHVDLEIHVADDGAVTGFHNRSRIHPALFLDLHPALAPDNAEVVRAIVGRQVFALLGPPGPDGQTKALPRLPLGTVALDDVQRVDLTIHAAPGPLDAYLAYRLAYRVQVVREQAPGILDPFFPSTGYFFRWTVDADTGEVIEDAGPPVSVPR